MVTSEIAYCQESSISFSRAFTLNQNQEESVLLRSCVLLGCYKQALRLTGSGGKAVPLERALNSERQRSNRVDQSRSTNRMKH